MKEASGLCVCVCVSDLWNILLVELRVWLSISNGSGGEKSAVIHSGRIHLPTGTAWDDACRLSCQVNGT